MARRFRASGDSLTQLDESELEGFNAYYCRFVKIGAPPLTLEEAELVLRLMSPEQRWDVMIALQKQE